MNLTTSDVFLLTAFSIFTAAALAVPASADTIGVSRCNSAGGNNAPTLHFVDGGQRYSIGIGEYGLTRRIIMSERRAMQWAQSTGMFANDTVFVNYDGYVCGMMIGEDQGADPEPAAAPAPPTDTTLDPID